MGLSFGRGRREAVEVTVGNSQVNYHSGLISECDFTGSESVGLVLLLLSGEGHSFFTVTGLGCSCASERFRVSSESSRSIFTSF